MFLWRRPGAGQNPSSQKARRFIERLTRPPPIISDHFLIPFDISEGHTNLFFMLRIGVIGAVVRRAVKRNYCVNCFNDLFY